jgi:hypothetical protein
VVRTMLIKMQTMRTSDDGKGKDGERSDDRCALRWKLRGGLLALWNLTAKPAGGGTPTRRTSLDGVRPHSTCWVDRRRVCSRQGGTKTFLLIGPSQVGSLGTPPVAPAASNAALLSTTRFRPRNCQKK